MILSAISTSFTPINRILLSKGVYDSQFFIDRESRIVLNNPIPDITTFEYFLFSDKDTVQDALEIINACKIELPNEDGKELALMPASDFDLRWIVGKTDQTDLMYRIAKNKNQIPMILVLKPICK